jgi:hypothetical protein
MRESAGGNMPSHRSRHPQLRANMATFSVTQITSTDGSDKAEPRVLAGRIVRLGTKKDPHDCRQP